MKSPRSTGVVKEQTIVSAWGHSRGGFRIGVDKSSSHQLSHSEIASDNPCSRQLSEKVRLLQILRGCHADSNRLQNHSCYTSNTQNEWLAVGWVAQRLVQGEPHQVEVSGSRRCAALVDTSLRPQRRSRPSCSGTASRCQSRRRERSRTRRPSAAWRLPRASG